MLASSCGRAPSWIEHSGRLGGSWSSFRRSPASAQLPEEPHGSSSRRASSIPGASRRSSRERHVERSSAHGSARRARLIPLPYEPPRPVASPCLPLSVEPPTRRFTIIVQSARQMHNFCAANGYLSSARVVGSQLPARPPAPRPERPPPHPGGGRGARRWVSRGERADNPADNPTDKNSPNTPAPSSGRGEVGAERQLLPSVRQGERGRGENCTPFGAELPPHARRSQSSGSSCRWADSVGGRIRSVPPRRGGFGRSPP